MPNKIFDNEIPDITLPNIIMPNFPHIPIPDFSNYSLPVYRIPDLVQDNLNFVTNITQAIQTIYKEMSKFNFSSALIKLKQELEQQNQIINESIKQLSSAFKLLSEQLTASTNDNISKLMSVISNLYSYNETIIEDIYALEDSDENDEDINVFVNQSNNLEDPPKKDIFKNLPTYQKISIISDYIDKLIAFIALLLPFIINASPDTNIINSETTNIQNNVTVNISQSDYDEILSKLVDFQEQINTLKEQNRPTEEPTEPTSTDD